MVSPPEIECACNMIGDDMDEARTRVVASREANRHERRRSSIRIRGVVQGVGFRPFVYRLAQEHGIAGWVLNGEEGVAIHAEGEEKRCGGSSKNLRVQAPPAAVDCRN